MSDVMANLRTAFGLWDCDGGGPIKATSDGQGILARDGGQRRLGATGRRSWLSQSYVDGRRETSQLEY